MQRSCCRRSKPASRDMRDASGSDDTVQCGISRRPFGQGRRRHFRIRRPGRIRARVRDGARRDSAATVPPPRPKSSRRAVDGRATCCPIWSACRATGQPMPPRYGSECRAALGAADRETSGDAAADDDGSPAPAEFDGIDFMPVRATISMRRIDEAPRALYAITFRPKPEMLKNANEPLYHAARTCASSASSNSSPKPTRCRRWPNWSPGVPISAGPARCAPRPTRSAIEEVFEFVAGDCELEIAELDAAARRRCRSAKCRTPAGGRRAVRSTVVAAARRRTPTCRRPLRRQGRRRRASRKRKRAHRGREVGADDDAGRARQDRPRRQHGRRTGDRAGHARADRPGPARRGGGTAVADARGRHPSYARAEGQRDVDARPAGRRGVPAHAASGPRALRQDRQESPARNARREHRGRPHDHRAPGRSAHPHHPQFDGSRHRIAGGAAGGRQERRRHHPACRRASRRPHRHRGQRRRRGNQFRARPQEGARKGFGRARRGAQRGRDHQSDLPARASRPPRRFPTFPAVASAWTSFAAISRISAAASRSSRCAGAA